MKITMTYPGNPVPFSRPRFNGKQSFNDPKYAQYKRSLSAFINREYGYFAWDIPKAGDKKRSKYLAANRYHLTVRAFRDENRGDVDNFLKTVQDALQDAGVIADDSQIDSIKAEKFIDKENPRIEFELETR